MRQLVSFYRATLRVRAVFAVARRLSVCRSIMLVYCIQTAEAIVKLLFRSGSAMILVFLTPGADTKFQGEPLQRGAKYKWWEKFAIFD